MLILPLNHLPASPPESCLLLHLSLGTKRVNDETQTLFAVREKAKSVRAVKTVERDRGSENGKRGWRMCRGRRGGGANDRCVCKFFILHRLLGKLLGRALSCDFTTNPVCKLLFIFCKVCQTQALISPPEFPLVARSRTCSPHNL